MSLFNAVCSRLLPLALLCAVSLLMTACGGKPMLVESPLEEATTKAPLLDYIATHDAGSTATIDDPAFGKGVRVFLEGSFLSATGQECRRATLLSRNGEAEVVVACKGDDGAWSLAPRIWGQGLSE